MIKTIHFSGGFPRGKRQLIATPVRQEEASPAVVVETTEEAAEHTQTPATDEATEEVPKASPDLPFTSAEEIQVGEMVDLEKQFLEHYQKGDLTTSQVGLPQNIIFAGWSPDSQHVLLHVSYGETREVRLDNNDTISAGVYHLWLHKLDGTESREIVVDEAGALPRWSSDGKRIAFLADSTLNNILVMPLPPGLPIAKDLYFRIEWNSIPLTPMEALLVN